jgi:oligoribonuclease NrnB/cAMP/cGMP phosphodiesterase (DHH superfamily)
LTYEKLLSEGHDLERFENLVDCVNDYDLWLLKRNDSKRMNLLFHLIGVERFEKRFTEFPYDGVFFPEESLIIELEEERRDKYIEKAIENTNTYKDKLGNTVAVVFAELYASELGNEIVCRGIADYVLIVNAQRGKCALRSKRDFDISGIAISNGGGGHKNAAGFSLKNDLNMEAILAEVGIL